MRGDTFSTHDQKPAHIAAVRFYEKALTRSENGLAVGIERHISVTSAKDIICRKIVTAYTSTKTNIAFEVIPDLNQMQAVNGLEMGGKSYDNHGFWASIVSLTADYFRQGRIRDIIESCRHAGFSLIVDGSGRCIADVSSP